MILIRGVSLTDIVKWSRWEKTGLNLMNKDLVFRDSPLNEVLDILEAALFQLAKHVKVADWQHHQYQQLKDNLPRGHAMCTVDFAENYLCKFQSKIQSAHWSLQAGNDSSLCFFTGVVPLNVLKPSLTL